MNRQQKQSAYLEQGSDAETPAVGRRTVTERRGLGSWRLLARCPASARSLSPRWLLESAACDQSVDHLGGVSAAAQRVCVPLLEPARADWPVSQLQVEAEHMILLPKRVSYIKQSKGARLGLLHQQPQRGQLRAVLRTPAVWG